MLAPSDRMQLPAHVSQGWLTFGDAWVALRNALDSAGYTRYGLFGIEGGFAVVTALERMQADGSSVNGQVRWTLKSQTQIATLSEYIAALFLGESGHYRLIAFVLSPQMPAPEGGESALSNAETAQKFFIWGRLDLPSVLGAQPFAGCHLYALVYEYERLPGQIKLNVPGVISSLQHLQFTGLLSAMGSH